MAGNWGCLCCGRGPRLLCPSEKKPGAANGSELFGKPAVRVAGKPVSYRYGRDDGLCHTSRLMVSSGQLSRSGQIQNPRDAKPGPAILPAVQQVQAATARECEVQPSIGAGFSQTLYSVPRRPAVNRGHFFIRNQTSPLRTG